MYSDTAYKISEGIPWFWQMKLTMGRGCKWGLGTVTGDHENYEIIVPLQRDKWTESTRTLIFCFLWIFHSSVEIYKSGTFKLLCVVHIHRKLVNSIQWHPIHNVETSSSQKYYIATGSNEATIQIVDLSSVLGGMSNNFKCHSI